MSGQLDARIPQQVAAVQHASWSTEVSASGIHGSSFQSPLISQGHTIFAPLAQPRAHSSAGA
jgi:hypothetical protein